MRKRVLVVDDEPGIRTLVSSILKTAGFEVVESCDGHEALAFMQHKPNDACVDVLVTDVVMPRVNGFEVAQSFMSMCPETRVVFMSGHCDVQSINMEIPQKKWTFVPKPFLAKTLLGAVEGVLS